MSRTLEEMAEDKFTYILMAAGTPQMYSHPIEAHGKPPEYIRQSLGWVSEKEGFAIRLFKYWKKTPLRDAGLEVLLYEEVIPNPALCYRSIDCSFFTSEVWETPSQRNIKEAWK
jgi:hypothetical protein